MKRSATGFAVALMTLVAAASPAAAAERVPVAYPADDPTAEQLPAQHVAHSRGLDVDVWINKDEGGIYRPGESMRVYFRANAECYVLVFNVDTEGYIHLVYPYGPDDEPTVEGGRTYRIPSRSDPYDLVADGPPGIEYVVAVASPFPFQNLPWYLSADRVDGDRPDLEDEGDDDTESGHLVGDPYVGIDRIIRRIAPPGREDRIATNETYFYIGRRVEYPRYVCADCHYHPFYFDPYVNACSAFEIRVDATWAHYAPIRIGTVRPRYIYRVRPQAPTRYRQWKSQWSSLDGRTMLRTRFLPERDIRYRRERPQQTRPARPEFRDLRRYRDGRIWGGRDEVLKLRERRDRVNSSEDRGWSRRDGRPGTPQDRGWRQRGERPSPSENRERARPQPPEDRGWRDRGDRPRPPADRGEGLKERPQPPEDRGSRERPAPPPEDRGARERPAPPREERNDRKDGGRGDKDHAEKDHGEKDRGDRGDKDRGGEQRDRSRQDRGDQDNGRGGRERPNSR
ncbi:MAG TPA: DUF4384 domain-containing protein [Candidatus Eisenbacteria bacterium]|nr:DUF4384 domain-containing protein [Candidatus Eisenbacteria bacterium]